jgi:hypothetical protein
MGIRGGLKPYGPDPHPQHRRKQNTLAPAGLEPQIQARTRILIFSGPRGKNTGSWRIPCPPFGKATESGDVALPVCNVTVMV